MMYFIISFFYFAPLHVRGHFPYIIKGDTSESLEQLHQWAINPNQLEKLSYLFTFTFHFVLITWIFELGGAVLSSVL